MEINRVLITLLAVNSYCRVATFALAKAKRHLQYDVVYDVIAHSTVVNSCTFTTLKAHNVAANRTTTHSHTFASECNF